MEILTQKDEILRPKSEITTKMHEYSSRLFNAYRTAVCWEGCYEQLMFHVKPLDDKGFEQSTDFYFRSIPQMLAFVLMYKKHHTLAFWESKQTILNSKETLLLMLHKSRMQFLKH